MRDELLKMMREIDAAAARMNAGLAAVALVLSLAVGLGLTLQYGQSTLPAMLDDPAATSLAAP